MDWSWRFSYQELHNQSQNQMLPLMKNKLKKIFYLTLFKKLNIKEAFSLEKEYHCMI